MKTAVIIPCYNREKDIVPALQSLADQEVLPDEIILVDNGSSDSTVKNIEEFIKSHVGLNIILTRESKRGPAAARNKGIKLSKADILLFMDSDCIADKGWIKNIIESFRDDAVVALGGTTRIYMPRNPVEKLQAIEELCPKEVVRSGKGCKNSFLLGHFPVTNNAAYRMNSMKLLGGFDESYLFGEDADIYLRLVEKLNTSEVILIHQQQMIMWHKPRKTLPELTKQIFLYRVVLARLVKAYFKGQTIIKLPFLGLFEINLPFLTIWINASFLVSIIPLLLCILLQKFIVYIVSAALLFFFVDTYREIQRCGFKGTLWDIMSIWFVSLVKKTTSELGRIYGSIKYRVISF